LSTLRIVIAVWSFFCLSFFHCSFLPSFLSFFLSFFLSLFPIRIPHIPTKVLIPTDLKILCSSILGVLLLSRFIPRPYAKCQATGLRATLSPAKEKYGGDPYLQGSLYRESCHFPRRSGWVLKKTGRDGWGGGGDSIIQPVTTVYRIKYAVAYLRYFMAIS
jgi:hypothetical protein